MSDPLLRQTVFGVMCAVPDCDKPIVVFHVANALQEGDLITHGARDADARYYPDGYGDGFRADFDNWMLSIHGERANA